MENYAEEVDRIQQHWGIIETVTPPPMEPTVNWTAAASVPFGASETRSEAAKLQLVMATRRAADSTASA